jgi:hypothetical protein
MPKIENAENTENIENKTENSNQDLEKISDSIDKAEKLVNDTTSDTSDTLDTTKQDNCNPCDNTDEPETAYEKKEKLQKELGEKAHKEKLENEAEEKTSLLSKLVEDVSDYLKNKKQTFVDKSTNIIKSGVETAKELPQKINEEAPSLLQKLFLPALLAITAWWSTASKHKGGVIGWLVEKVWNGISTGSKYLWEWIKETAWPAIKDFFTGENFIYKLFWGDDGSGEKSGILFEIKKYFSSGKALEHLQMAGEFIGMLLDKMYTFLFGEYWTNSKKWVQESMNSILGWWSDVSNKGGIGSWLYYEIWNLLKDKEIAGVKIGDYLPTPAAVEKEELRIKEEELRKKQDKEKDRYEYEAINKAVDKKNNQKIQEWRNSYISYYKSVQQEAKISNKNASYVNEKVQTWIKNNPRPKPIKRLTFNEFMEYKSSGKSFSTIFQNNNEANVLQNSSNINANITNNTANTANTVQNSTNNPSEFYESSSTNTNIINTNNISAANNVSYSNNVLTSNSNTSNINTLNTSSSKVYEQNLTIDGKTQEEKMKSYDAEIVMLAKSQQVLNNKIEAQNKETVDSGLFGTLHKI